MHPTVAPLGSKLRVDVWSDIVCPWCHVGRAHLLAAAEKLGLTESLEIVHHSYQLDPAQTRSEPVRDFLSRRYGAGFDFERTTGRVRELGNKVGLELDFERAITANTRDAHRLVHFAQEKGKGDTMMERLMRAHFSEGLDVSKHDVLGRLSNEVGLDANETAEVLSSGRFSDKVDADIKAARELGVRGVPFFVFDERLGLSGAQPIDVFVEALTKAQSKA